MEKQGIIVEIYLFVFLLGLIIYAQISGMQAPKCHTKRVHKPYQQ